MKRMSLIYYTSGVGQTSMHHERKPGSRVDDSSILKAYHNENMPGFIFKSINKGYLCSKSFYGEICIG